MIPVKVAANFKRLTRVFLWLAASLLLSAQFGAAATPSRCDQLFGQPSKIVIDGQFYEFIERGPLEEKIMKTSIRHGEIEGKEDVAEFINFFRHIDWKELSKKESEPFFDKNVAFGTPVVIEIVASYSDGTSRKFGVVGSNALVAKPHVYEARKGDIHAFLLAAIRKSKADR